MSEQRERELALAVGELAQTLAGSTDAADLLGVLVARSLELLDSDAAAVLLTDDAGRLRVVAASDERTAATQRQVVSEGGGPAVDAHRTGEVVLASPDGATAGPGAGSSCAVPLHVQRTALGALVLLRRDGLLPDDVQVLRAQALADVAAIGLLQRRAVRQAELLAEQLQHALDSRVVLEQAKGVLAERLEVDVDEAFAVLRRAARNSNTRLADYARNVVQGPPAPRSSGRTGSSGRAR